MFRLLPGVLPGQPGRPVAVRVEGTSVCLEWNAAAEDDGGLIPIGYIIKYKLAGSDPENVDTEQVDEVTLSHELRGKLQPQTSYVFAVAAKTENGEEGPLSEFSDVVQTNTGNYLPMLC